MSIVFLECDYFGIANIVCCERCHEKREKLISVRPFTIDYDARARIGASQNTDWGLCVEAIVCCTLYDYVRNLPREWWVEQSKKYGVTRQDEFRGYIYPNSPERNTMRENYGLEKRASNKNEKVPKNPAKGAAARLKAVLDDEFDFFK
jgi:hypothetical protein